MNDTADAPPSAEKIVLENRRRTYTPVPRLQRLVLGTEWSVDIATTCRDSSELEIPDSIRDHLLSIYEEVKQHPTLVRFLIKFEQNEW